VNKNKMALRGSATDRRVRRAGSDYTCAREAERPRGRTDPDRDGSKRDGDVRNVEQQALARSHIRKHKHGAAAQHRIARLERILTHRTNKNKTKKNTVTHGSRQARKIQATTYGDDERGAIEGSEGVGACAQSTAS
jgi:hypothetical protein